MYVYVRAYNTLREINSSREHCMAEIAKGSRGPPNIREGFATLARELREAVRERVAKVFVQHTV